MSDKATGGIDTVKLPERGGAVSLDLIVKIPDAVMKMVSITTGLKTLVQTYFIIYRSSAHGFPAVVQVDGCREKWQQTD